MTEMAPEPDQIGRVNQNLTIIAGLYEQLPDEAANDADSDLMPGGRAMLALGPVANHEAWENLNAATERYGRAYTFADLEDDDGSWLAAQIIQYWAEQWRRHHGAEYDDQKRTLTTEINFVRNCLPWAIDNLSGAEWAAFAESIHSARFGLEDILTEGKRAKRGVPCLDCGIDLIRVSRDPHEPTHCDGIDGELCAWPHKFCPHDRGGLVDEWKCTSCDRRYESEDYFRAVHHAHFIHADYLTIDDAAARTGVRAGTIKVWATRGKVGRHKDPGAVRVSYSVADIEAARDGEEVA